MNTFKDSFALSRWFYSFIPVSVTLIFFGVNFIIESLIEVKSLEKVLNIEEVAKFKSNFKIREDISIKQSLRKHKYTDKDVLSKNNPSINLDNIEVCLILNTLEGTIVGGGAKKRELWNFDPK